MKAIRVVALGVALLIAGAVTARAQAGTPQGQAGRRPSPMLDNMMLTDAQKAKIEGINRKYQPDMQAIAESMGNGADRSEMRSRRLALLAKMQPEIRAVLTPDQQVIFDKNVSELNARIEQMNR